MGDLERIEGKFLLFLFRNEKNFYTVARFRLKDSSRKVLTVTGYLPDPETGPNYRLEGTYTDNPKYGLQFQIVTYAKMRPDDVEGILYYLSGPKFPGIGTKTAMKLLEDFGKDVMDRIQNDPSCLDNVSYLSEKKKEVLREGLRNSEEEDEQIYRFFAGHKLTMKQIVTIQKVYGAEAIDILKEDPYRMVKDVPGIGFETADEFAMSLGMDAADRKRLCALGAKLLSDAVMSSGSSYLRRDEWESLFARYTSGLDYDQDEIFRHMSFERLARFEEDRVYPIAQYEAELTIAMYLKKFPHEPLRKIPSGELEERIARLEETFGIRYDAAQREAIEAFFEEDFMILTGGPGTGKSTIVRAILALIKELYPTSTASVVTPTGRAAKRLKELTDYDARTIHSLLGYDLDTQSFSYNRDNPVLSDIVIADEFSMVDQYLFAKLLDAGAFFRKILLIGDEDQLPSVAPGQVLSDLMRTEKFRTIRLKNIYRQAEGSGIITLAHKIADDAFEDFGSHDVRFIDASAYEVNYLVRDQVERALDAGYAPTDIQVMAPKYNGTNGIDQLNRILQEATNPKDQRKRELNQGYRTFRIGDKILQLKNQPNENVYNGDIGILIGIEYAKESETKEDKLTVDYDGVVVEYTRENFENITHAYCVSVHKAQGSEYPVVILPVVREYGIMLQKRLLYTAVTRAEKHLVIIGDRAAFEKGVRTKDRRVRNTTLEMRIAQEEG